MKTTLSHAFLNRACTHLQLGPAQVVAQELDQVGVHQVRQRAHGLAVRPPGGLLRACSCAGAAAL